MESRTISNIAKREMEGEKKKVERWCPSTDPEKLWERGVVVAIAGDQCRLRLGEDNEAPRSFLLSETHPVEDSHLKNLDNIAEMDNLHVAPLLELLHRRHQQDMIYTRTADILISLNPFKDIPDLYTMPSDEELLLRAGQEPGDGTEGAPHVYSIANHAYCTLLHARASQSVLVSGESGAGKTEA